MKKYSVFILFLFLSSPAFTAETSYPIYVVSSGKHSGILIPKINADISYLSNRNVYKNSEFIEYGYGDKDYYMSKTDPSIYIGVKAVFWPSSSVVKILTTDINKYKKEADAKLYELYLNKEQLRLLKKYIKDTFYLKDNKAYPIGKSSYDSGIFYNGTRDFYMFNTCNSWVIKSLKYSGLDVSDWFVVRRMNLDNELEDLIAESEKESQDTQPVK